MITKLAIFTLIASFFFLTFAPIITVAGQGLALLLVLFKLDDMQTKLNRETFYDIEIVVINQPTEEETEPCED